MKKRIKKKIKKLKKSINKINKVRVQKGRKEYTVIILI